MIRTLIATAAAAWLVLAATNPAVAQRSLADVLGQTPTPEGKPKTFLDEVTLFSYIENSVPAEQILLEAERHDLIVLGRESHFHFETQATADETVKLVLRAMPRPVISVTGDVEAPGPVLVAYGTGVHSSRALQMFALLHPPLESDVVVVAVDSEETPVDGRAARAVQFLEAHSISARTHVVASHQPVADILIELAAEWEARMVVMGVHLVGELGARLFGSVTASMLEDAARPLFLYH